MAIRSNDLPPDEPDPDVMQINSRNLGLLGLELADAFDPCRSIAGAARLMSLFSAYNTGSPTSGFANGYAQAVVASIEKVRVVAALPPAFTPATTSSASQPKLRLRDQVVSFSTR
jgi:type IV secretion system protein VirB1